MRENIHSSQDPDVIKDEISRTRRRMDDNLDRLAERFRPRHILNDILDLWQNRRSRRTGSSSEGSHVSAAIQENARKAGRTVAHQLRENAMPSLLVGAGLAWLIIDRMRSDREPRAYDPAEDYYGPPGAAGSGAYGSGYNPGTGSPGASYNPDYPEDYDQGVYGAQPAGTYESEGKTSRFAGEARRRFREKSRHLRERGQHLRERASERSHRIRERAGEMTHGLTHRVREGYQHTQEKIMQGYQQAQEKIAEGYHQAQERVAEGYHHAQERVSEGYRYTQDKIRETADLHPLATGAACLGIGLLAGFLLPRTRREDEWLGAPADAFKERVKETSEDLVSRGKHVAQAASQAAQTEAERQGLTPEHLKEGAKAVGQEAQKAAQRSAEAEGLSSKSNKPKTSVTGASSNPQGSARPSI